MRLAFACILGLAGATVALRAAGAQSVWHVDPRPLLDIADASLDGHVVLERPMAGTRLANGNIVVADDGAATVRFFDASGRLRRAVGRRGNGPGEFRRIWWIGQCRPDSVFVWDFLQRRMTVLSASGVVVRQYPVPAEPGAGALPYAVACSVAGVFAYQTTARNLSPSSPGSPIQRGRATLSLGDARGNITRTVAEVASGELVELGGGGGPRPLGKVTSFAVARDRLFVGTADSASVDAYELDGRPLAAVRVSIPQRAATREQYERAVNAVTSLVPPRVREAVGLQMRSLPVPEYLPPYTALFVDVDHTLWLVVSPPGERETLLRALDATGEKQSDVRIPIALIVYEIGHDYILGSYEDESGEPHVVMYRLRRG